MYILHVHVYSYIFEFVYALSILCSVYGCCKYRPTFRKDVSNIIIISVFFKNNLYNYIPELLPGVGHNIRWKPVNRENDD